MVSSNTLQELNYSMIYDLIKKIKRWIDNFLEQVKHLLFSFHFPSLSFLTFHIYSSLSSLFLLFFILFQSVYSVHSLTTYCTDHCLNGTRVVEVTFIGFGTHGIVFIQSVTYHIRLSPIFNTKINQTILEKLIIFRKKIHI